MESLDLLWKLESQWNLLNSVKEELVDLDNDSGVKAIKKKTIALEKRLQSSKVQEEKAKEKLIEIEKQLNMNNFNIEEIEKGLYDGHTSDIKQLEYLSVEKEKLKTRINKIETEVLEFMVKLEDLGKEIKITEDELNTIADQEEEIRNNHKTGIINLNKRLLAIEEKIESYENKIDADLLTEYNRVKKSRGVGIVELKDSICTGCNIKASTLVGERIKTTKQIFHCESCGRILYYKIGQ